MELKGKYICCKCWKVLHMGRRQMEGWLDDGVGHLEYSALHGESRWKYYCNECDRKYYSDYYPTKKEERKF